MPRRGEERVAELRKAVGLAREGEGFSRALLVNRAAESELTVRSSWREVTVAGISSRHPHARHERAPDLLILPLRVVEDVDGDLAAKGGREHKQTLGGGVAA